ncbi:ATP-binding cassette domain-containing protein [Zymobacter sp. IVIA_12111.31 C1]|uniref:ATP-binding cassette domain-containing protein n=1 Tax=Zymobacter sp. IVIA_12111.31 C1 TaxID=3394854 RepID=UPI0039C11098
MSEAVALSVDARGVGKRFTDASTHKPIDALAEVDVRVAHGALTALVGPDGAGKTTFLRLVAGLMRPTEGELKVLGIDVARHPQAVQDRISYMPQRFGLYEDLSIQENLDLYADLHGVPADERKERFARLLEMTDLTRFTTRPAGKLSGGMKQKLGLACTLVRSPELLLLDEPTVGVDPLSRRELWEIVQQLIKEEQLTVLLATSYMDEAAQCADVYVMHEGKVLASGLPEEIAGRAQGRCYDVAPHSDEPARQLQAQLLDDDASIVDAVPHGGRVHFILRDDAALKALPLYDRHVEPVEESLEDGFMVLLRALSKERPADAAHAMPDAVDGTSEQHEQPIIEVRDLVRRFGDFVAVDKTTFSVSRGEIFGLLGPNGAGKTTTFRMLCGLLPASSGQAHVAGMDMRTARAQARSRIGYVSQKFALYANLSVQENLRFFGGTYGLRGKRLRERMRTVLAQFDLEGHETQAAGQLPGGIKQRLAMAVGLLHEPDILFLDEPTSGADPLARRSFWRRITALASAGTTIVITTHFMEEAEYCDRIVIQDAGRLLALGTPEEVRQQAGETPDKRLDMEQAFIGIVERARAKRQADAA